MTDECRIWLDDTKFAVVDEIDFAWAKQWKWQPLANSTGLKFYAVRNTTIDSKRVKLFLHKEILKRSGKKRRSVHHTIGDHEDGDSLNDRRDNLSWATIKMNNNRHRQQKLIEQKEMRFEHDYDSAR